MTCGPFRSLIPCFHPQKKKFFTLTLLICIGRMQRQQRVRACMDVGANLELSEVGPASTREPSPHHTFLARKSYDGVTNIHPEVHTCCRIGQIDPAGDEICPQS
ncbi:hypothetical protein HBH58_140810 [Parastagonospora nodorum]|nr:hypothetical protein HBH58_140810 [Parastagonospora nodorum]